MQLLLPLDIEESKDTGTIFERIKTCKSLPILSPLASKILKMCQDEETPASTLADVIAQDPGMAAQILFMANSAYYGGARHKVPVSARASTYSDLPKLPIWHSRSVFIVSLKTSNIHPRWQSTMCNFGGGPFLPAWPLGQLGNIWPIPTRSLCS